MGFNQPKGVDYYAGVPVEMGKGLVRGFGSGLLSAGAGLAELADVGTDLIGLDDLIDSGDENELIRLAKTSYNTLPIFPTPTRPIVGITRSQSC